MLSTPSPISLWTVRIALLMLHEDPPLGLADTELAKLLVADEFDKLARGQLLHQLLSTAIERLRPKGDIDPTDRAWWPYLICIGEYQERRQRADVRRELVVGVSTYTRSKRRALDRIADLLPYLVQSAQRERTVGGE